MMRHRGMRGSVPRALAIWAMLIAAGMTGAVVIGAALVASLASNARSVSATTFEPSASSSSSSSAAASTSATATSATARADVGGAAATTTPAGLRPIPVYAYFYQWFNASSWNRAKKDLPLAGRYSSDDAHVLRDQVQQARDAGIDGFLTSWKSTPTLNRRLELLLRVAKTEHLDVGVVYEALDFARKPLPVATVQQDMVYLVEHWGADLKSRYYGRPVIIWTGTEKYSVADVQQVRTALGDRAYLLAAARNVSGYEKIAGIVDGEAYYWSSADPNTSSTLDKLRAMSDAVHAHQGLWIAPAAAGYDGTALGGTRVIERADGATLEKSLDNAFASSPDGLGVISWNEWSENTYIEPGGTYGSRDLNVLTSYLRNRGLGIPNDLTGADSSEGNANSGWTGARAALTMAVLAVVGVPGLALLGRRRASRELQQRRPGHASSGGDRPPALVPPGSEADPGT